MLNQSANTQTIPFKLKTTNEGVEILILPHNANQMLKGVAEGYKLEKSNDGQQWTVLNSKALQPAFLDNFPASPSPAERILYGKFHPQATPENGLESPEYKKAMRGFHDMVISNLPADRAGLQRSGLWWQDAAGRAGTMYRVSFWNATNGDAQMLAAPAPALPLKSPEIKYQPDGSSQIVTLYWERQDVPVGYWVERAVNNGAFERMTSYLLLEQSDSLLSPDMYGNVVFSDSIPIDGNNYRYRLSSVDLFAQNAPYGPELVIKGEDLRDPARPIVQAPIVDIETGEIQLNWSIDDSSPKPEKYHILVSDSIEGTYQQALTVAAVETSALLLWQSYPTAPASPNTLFLQVVSVGENGQESYAPPIAAFMPDNTPPPTPTELAVTIDSNGVARLSWTGKRVNDLHKYSIQRRSERNDDYVEIFYGLPAQNEFNDQIDLKLGRKQVAYRISAIDRVGNRSPYSAPTKAIVPDKIAPPTPIIKAFEAEKDSLLFIWDIAQTSDIAYFLFELKQGKTAFSRQEKIKSDQTYWLKGGFSPNTYQIRVSAIDSSGNQSPWASSPIIHLYGKKAALAPPPAVTALALDRDAESLQLTWADGIAGDIYYLFLKKTDQDEDELISVSETNQCQLPSNLAQNSQLYLLRERGGRISSPSATIKL